VLNTASSPQPTWDRKNDDDDNNNNKSGSQEETIILEQLTKQANQTERYLFLLTNTNEPTIAEQPHLKEKRAWNNII